MRTLSIRLIFVLVLALTSDDGPIIKEEAIKKDIIAHDRLNDRIISLSYLSIEAVADSISSAALMTREHIS